MRKRHQHQHQHHTRKWPAVLANRTVRAWVLGQQWPHVSAPFLSDRIENWGSGTSVEDRGEGDRELEFLEC